MIFSQTEISFLNQLPQSIKVDMSSSWRYQWVDLQDLKLYLNKIGDNKIYLIVPLLASKQDKPAILKLSDPFLINNESNPKLIFNFIMSQWQNSGFSLNDSKGFEYSFSFKMKRVWIS